MRVLRNQAARDVALQVAIVATALLAVALLAWNTAETLRARGVPIGFGFLSDPAGFTIQDRVVPFTPADTYAMAILVGVSNTLLVAVLVIPLASVAGLLVGLGRMSANPLVAALCRAWVEIARNTPAIVLLLFIYGLWAQILPPVRQALLVAPGVYISQRGLVLPRIDPGVSLQSVLAALSVLLFATWAAARVALRLQDLTGRRPPLVPIAFTATLVLALGTCFTIGRPATVEWPTLGRANFIGGVELTPELSAITIGLSFYTAGFIAEIVRAGVLAIQKGQWEAGFSVGLSRGRVLRLIVIPQMLRVVIPPLTSQYINVVKNSTLAIVVGFQDFLTIMSTIINQTSHALEGIAIVLAVYLLINLSLSTVMNWLNRRFALVER
jgi:general L-amino acid transport system permease protein